MDRVTVERVCKMYLAGLSSAEISKDFGVTSSTIRCWLELGGVPRRSKSITSRKYSYRKDAFLNATSDDAYFAGLLMADGSISDRGHVSLEISRKDIVLLHELKEHVCFNGPIKERSRTSKSGSILEFASIRFVAHDLVKHLRMWGLVPRKSRRAVIGDIVFDNGLEGAFFKGLFDGDGCVHVRANGTKYLSLCGYPGVIDSFRDWCWKNVRLVGSLNQRSDRFHVVQFGGKSAGIVGGLIYDDNERGLERKRGLICGV